MLRVHTGLLCHIYCTLNSITREMQPSIAEVAAQQLTMTVQKENSGMHQACSHLCVQWRVT